ALLTNAGLEAARKAAMALPADPATTVLSTLDTSANDCRSIATLVAAGGEVGAAAARLEAERAAVALAETRADDLKQAFAAAKKTYDESARTLLGDPSDPKAREAVEKAIAKLDKLVAAVKSAQDSFSTKLIAEERLASLDAFLTTYKDVAAGKGVQDGNKVAIALAVFPDLREKTRAALRDLEKPNLVPLAMQKNIELVKLEAAQKDIALRRQVVAEREAEVASLDAQVLALTEARGLFADPAIQALKGKLLVDVMNEGGKDGLEGRTKLWRSSTRFLDAEGRLRAETGKASYRISTLEHEKALTLAEANINQWKALIDPSVELMAAYGAAGLKSSDLIALFNSITLLWIGVGVN
ncbi:MAG TPA: hypothetical protein VIY56_17855, partial [Vicinamibacterales bacterium]